MSIVLLGELSAGAYETWQEQLRPHLPPDEHLVIAPRCADKNAVDIALAANPAWGELATYPNLRFVQSLWAGVDRLLGDPELPADITIARLVDPMLAQSMVEGAIADVLYAHRQFPAYLRQQAARQWRQRPQPVAAHTQVGLLGFGRMGQPVGLALATLGFKVKAWGLHSRDATGVEYFWGASGLKKTLAGTQILVNLLPLTAATVGILNMSLFDQLARGAAVINLGRGQHLNEDDLLTALQSGRIEHAVLDVFQREPLSPEHVFWTHPQITVLPHVAAYTDPHTAAPIATANIAAFRAGRAVTGLVSRSLGY